MKPRAQRLRKQNPRRTALSLSLACLAFGLFSCDEMHHGGIRETLEREGGPEAARIADSAFDPVALEKLYAGLRLVAHRDTSTGDTLWLEDRRPQIRRFPCSQCHADLGKTTGPRDAHFGLSLAHAQPSVMQCATCHGQSMARDSLTSLNGQNLSFATSFQLCAQCHMTQARDFIGGSHGKRLGGWAGPRVMRNCTGCHDPHAPQIAKRWPSASATRRDLK